MSFSYNQCPIQPKTYNKDESSPYMVLPTSHILLYILLFYLQECVGGHFLFQIFKKHLKRSSIFIITDIILTMVYKDALYSANKQCLEFKKMFLTNFCSVLDPLNKLSQDLRPLIMNFHEVCYPFKFLRGIQPRVANFECEYVANSKPNSNKIWEWLRGPYGVNL